MSDYFDPNSNRIPRGSMAKSEHVNTLRDEVSAGFDKLPAPDKLAPAADFGTEAGAVNAYVVTLEYSFSAYFTGQRVRFVPSVTNTGASTINVNSVGIKAIKRPDGSDVKAGDLSAGTPVVLQYNGTYFILDAPLSFYAESEANKNAAAASASAAATSETNAATSETKAAASEAAATTQANYAAEQAHIAENSALGTMVDTPSITAPSVGAVDWNGTFTSSAYSTGDNYKGAHDYSHWQISFTADFAQIEYESTVGNLTSWNQIVGAPSQIAYVRVRHGSDGHLSPWSDAVSFTTPNIYIQTPTATDPADGATDILETPTLTADVFVCVNDTDTHASSSWQVATDSGLTNIVYESLNDTSNLESITIPSEILEVSTQYYWRVKYTGATYGDSSYSSVVSFTTKDTFEFYIGTAGGEGFGVAPANYDVSSLGLAEMTGTTTLGHDNYGNYIHTATGSIMCHVPKFFYRVGHSSSPQYATYGANALDIVGTDVYATEAAANAAGYVMPRAFIDGGTEKDGFFIDKYTCSPADNNKGVSVKNGVPISLIADSNYTNSGSMSGCDGRHYDVITLSRARGTGFNCATAFLMGAIAILSVAHAQAATSATHCAWYDSSGTTNFPKGCNDNSLGDTNDSSVTYTTAGDSGDANKPLTGSGIPFAKTTHNGQNCGICDLNGGMNEVAIGVTNYGTSDTVATTISNDGIYILKQSVAIKDLTAGWDGTNDVWGNTTHMGTLYDSVTSPYALGSTTGGVYWGSGSNAVFSADASGVSRDLCGFVPKNNSASDATGTNQFGNDYLFRNNRQNLVTLYCGSWASTTGAGLFFRNLANSRSYNSYTSGFRACAYV